MARGGARKGAGRKKKFGQDTKLARVPINSSPEDVKVAIDLVEQLRLLVEEWERQAQEAASQSKTGTYPRTYDKALKLLAELGVLLPSVSDYNLKD